MGIYDDFKKFVNQGNFVTLAVAFVVGLALNTVVQALVADLITPLIGAFFHADFSSTKVMFHGSTFLVGDLVNKALGFVIDLGVVFLFIVYPMEQAKARADARKPAAVATTRACPECLSQVPIGATRCAFCAQPLPAVTPATPTKPAA